MKKMKECIEALVACAMADVAYLSTSRMVRLLELKGTRISAEQRYSMY